MHKGYPSRRACRKKWREEILCVSLSEPTMTGDLSKPRHIPTRLLGKKERKRTPPPPPRGSPISHHMRHICQWETEGIIAACKDGMWCRRAVFGSFVFHHCLSSCQKSAEFLYTCCGEVAHISLEERKKLVKNDKGTSYASDTSHFKQISEKLVSPLSKTASQRRMHS